VVGIIGEDCQCELYADDLKIYSEIKTQIRNTKRLEGSLDALTRWSRDIYYKAVLMYSPGGREIDS